jgi:hypothetical protein
MLRTPTAATLMSRQFLPISTSIPTQTSRLALLRPTRLFSSSLSRLDQPPSFPNLDPKIASALKDSPIGRMLVTDPDVKHLFERFKSVIERKGQLSLSSPLGLDLRSMKVDVFD